MDRKRPLEEPTAQEPRKRSRFGDAPASTTAAAASAMTAAAPPASGLPADELARAAAMAAAAAASIASQIRAAQLGSATPSAALAGGMTGAAMERAALLQAQLQRAAVSGGGAAAMTGGAGSSAAATAPKPGDMLRAGLPPPLLIDSQGRAIDAQGNLLQTAPLPRADAAASSGRGVGVASGTGSSGTSVFARDREAEQKERQRKAAAAAAAAATTASGKINPYLAHRVQAATAAAAATPSDGAAAGGSSNGAPVDDRIATASRARRGAHALQFVEEGRYSSIAEEMRQREAQQSAIAAYREKGTRNRPVFHRELEESAPAPAASVAAPTTTDGTAAPATDSAAAAAPPAAPAAAAAASLALFTPPPARVPPKPRGAVPELEWWDAAFLPPARIAQYANKYSAAGAAKRKAAAAAADGGSASASASAAAPSDFPPFTISELNIENQKTWTLVQHPVPIVTPAAAEAAAPVALPLMLTKKERKKARRRTREERHKFLQDQIRLGLLPPPEPKVRLGNIMRVLKDSSVADPSAVEARVRAQVAQRIRNHELRNLNNKLSPAERAEKWKKKMSSHSAAGPDAALFRVSDLSDKQNRYKVEVNAKDHFLSGVVLICRLARVNLVLVEGGTRAVNRFTRQMMRRIQWKKEEEEGSDEDSEDEDEDADAGGGAGGGGHGMMPRKDTGAGPGRRCEMVWRGTVPKPYFSEFRFEEVKTASAARKFMELKGLAHCWDIVMHSARAAAGDDDEDDDDEEEGGHRPILPSLAAVAADLAAAGFKVATAGSTQEGDADEDDDEGDEEEESDAGADTAEASAGAGEGDATMRMAAAASR